MDCPRTLFLAAALGVGIAGCDAKTLPLWPTSPVNAATPPSMEQVESDSAEPSAAEIAKATKANMVFPKVNELKPATLVAFAALREQATAKTPAEALQNREDARKAYRRALELDPQYVPAHLGMARLHESQNDHKAGLASYREVLRLSPEDPKHWLEVGLCHARHKEWPPAIECFRKAYQLAPEMPACGKNLGLCLARAGQPEEALVLLMRVEGEAQAHYTVARMLHHIKQDEAAKKYLHQALVADSKLQGARQLLAELEGGLPPSNINVSVFQPEAK